MASLKCLLALVALAMVASAPIGATEDLFHVCQRIDQEINVLSVSIDDPEDVFDYAESQLVVAATSSELKTKLLLERLIYAWDNVIHKAECETTTFDYVAVIARCPRSKNLKTLIEATKKFVKNCLEPKYVESKIKPIAQGPNTEAARKFIDSDFIRVYRDQNPNERPIFLGINCCEPKRSISAIIDSIRRDIPDKNLKKEFGRNERGLSMYLKEHLFMPCKEYLEAMDDVMFDLWHMLDLFEQGQEELFAAISLEGQNDVFRYKLCLNLQYASVQGRIAQKVYNTIRES